MTDFKNIDLGDTCLISEYLKYCQLGLCDFTTPTLYMWRNYFKTQFLQNDSFMIFRHMNFEGKKAYLYPICKLSFAPAMDYIYKYEIEKEGNKTINFCVVPEQKCDEITSYFKSRCAGINVRVTSDAAWDDYIYLKDEIFGFPGKKLHGQKNHLNFFNKSFSDFVYSEITPENTRLLKDFVVGMGLDQNANDIEKAEYEGLVDYLDNFSSFPESFGGFLHNGKKIAGFAIAERVGEYLVIHNEKADKSYRGAYQKVFDCIMQQGVTQNIKYINREEDCGDPGLRYAKTAYHPHGFIKKCTISISGF